MKKALLAVTLLLFWASSAWGQRDGIPSFTAYDSHDTDTINLTSLVPTLHFSGPAGISLTSPQSCFASAVGTSCSTWGSAVQPLTALYYIPDPFFGLGPQSTAVQSGGPGCYSITITGLVGSDGLSVYPMPSMNIYNKTGCGGVTSATGTTYDGSGYTATFSGNTSQIPLTSNLSRMDGATASSAGNTVTIDDAFSNSISFDFNNGSGGSSFTNLLGAVLTLGGTNWPVPTSFQYVDTTGTNQNVTFTNGTATTFHPLGNCGTGNTGNSVTPITSINFPDSTSIGLTWDTNSTGIDGLIKTVTLRTGGTITYGYGTLSQNCNAGWALNTLTRTTADGTWNYSASTVVGTPTITTTTVLDPGKNKTVYTLFYGPTGPTFTSTIDRYQNTGTVASPSYTHISETQYCYNNNSCSTAPGVAVVTQLDTYEYTYTPTPTQVQMSHDVKLYDSTYGLITSDAKTDSITSQTITTTYVYGTFSSGSCSALGNTAIHDHICTVTTKNGTTWLSGSTYTYNSNGALTSSSQCLSSTCTGSSALTTTYTPTTHGTYSAIQDPNGQTVSYTYGSCNSLMPTDVTTTVNSIAIDHKATWNCNAGVVTDMTDANNNEADYTYDSMNRLSTYHDYMGDTNTTSYAYGTPTLDHTKVTDNIGVVSYQYVDGLGRPLISQIYNGTNYNTVSSTYGWKDSGNNALTNFQTTTSVACQTTLDATCSTVAVTGLTNPIAGPYKTTDANSGTGTYAVNSKDFSFTAGPAPTGENTKVVQTEVDGFGRVTSTCALEASGGTTCGQTMGNSGILTSNTYSFATGAPKVVATRGSQSHTTIADAVGRTTSIQTPEANTVTYLYDSDQSSDTCSNRTAPGDLLKVTKSGSSIYECYIVDGIHRVTDVKNTTDSSTSPCKRFRYDSTANKYQSTPTGYPTSGANLIGRLMEAETDDCTHTTALTDEWFAYDNMGRTTDMWESTPNSSGFYHTTVAYDADGQITSLSGIPGDSTITYGVDAMDRWIQMKYGTTTIVNATGFSYDAAGNPTDVPIGAGTDQDVFTYDSMENMTGYTFNVATKADAGTLTWNSIGSLGKLVINDTIATSTDSQTCSYGYDDVGRLTGVTTGTSCNAAQTFAYDQYDNMWQSGSFSWGCSTCYSSTTNEQTGTPTFTYDSDGNVKYDGTNSYTWNAYGKLLTTLPGSTAGTCGATGVTCYVYDAIGNLVEYQFNGSDIQYLFSPMGRISKMNGQTRTWDMVPAPGKGYLFENGGNYFIHTDWLGSSRLVDTVSGTIWNIQAYTPYGNPYNNAGNVFNLFAGDIQDESGLGLYLTPNRNLPQNASRWLSPDPAHSGWNAYAYVTDPNTQTDPSGLNMQTGQVNVTPFEDCRPDNPCPTQVKVKVDIPLKLSVDAQGFLSGLGHGLLPLSTNHPFVNGHKYVSGDVSAAGGPPPHGMDFVRQFFFGSDRLKLQSDLGLSQMGATGMLYDEVTPLSGFGAMAETASGAELAAMVDTYSIRAGVRPGQHYLEMLADMAAGNSNARHYGAGDEAAQALRDFFNRRGSAQGLIVRNPALDKAFKYMVTTERLYNFEITDAFRRHPDWDAENEIGLWFMGRMSSHTPQAMFDLIRFLKEGNK